MASQPPVWQQASVAETGRFPAGAAWLIGLGTLFLLGNLLPSWRVDGRWLVPLLLAATAVWTGGRRLTAPSATGLPRSDTPSALANLLFGPMLLLAVAILLALQDAAVISMRRSWPALLILWGALLLLQRATLPASSSPPATPGQERP